MKKFAAAVVVALFFPVSLNAFVVGPSNFDFIDYPDHKCSQPWKPYSSDSYARDRFKYEVEEYRDCIKKYVEAAKNDREHITEKANKAIDEFNYFIRSY